MQETCVTTRNMLCVLKKEGLIKIKKNIDREKNKLDKVFEDFKSLADQNIVRVYESTSDPYEMIIVSNEMPFKNFFIV